MAFLFHVLGWFAGIAAVFYGWRSKRSEARALNLDAAVPPQPKQDKNTDFAVLFTQTAEWMQAKNVAASAMALWRNAESKNKKWKKRSEWLHQKAGSKWLMVGNWLLWSGLLVGSAYAIVYHPSETRIAAGCLVWVVDNVVSRLNPSG